MAAEKILDKSQYLSCLEKILRKLRIADDFLNFITYNIKHDTENLLNMIINVTT